MTTLFRKFRIFHFASLLILAFTCGCDQNFKLDYTEVKRIDERVTNREYRSFLKVIRRLPKKNILKFPTVYIPPPDWKPTRALPVSGLVQEEQEKHAQRWNEEWLARFLASNRPLQKALKYERMTPEQFVGLTLTIGVAMSRSRLRKDQDLEKLISKGRKHIKRLSSQEETFSKIKDKEKQFSILNKAVWITRVSRAEKLIDVPNENIAFVQKHLDHLVKIFPEEFSNNPLDSIADILEELGLPFHEPESGVKDSEIGKYLWIREKKITDSSRY